MYLLEAHQSQLVPDHVGIAEAETIGTMSAATPGKEKNLQE